MKPFLIRASDAVPNAVSCLASDAVSCLGYSIKTASKKRVTYTASIIRLLNHIMKKQCSVIISRLPNIMDNCVTAL